VTEPAGDRLRILPALFRIRARHGYLDSRALTDFARQAGIPLHRLQEVGSYFPVFRPARPPRVQVRVCRDMACFIAGSGVILEQLRPLAREELSVDGVSCLGRCDRAPAACVAAFQDSVPGNASLDERYYVGRAAPDLEDIARRTLAGAPPPADHDADLASPAAAWEVDPYRGRISDYAAVRQALAARAAAASGPRPDDWSDAALHEFDEADLRGLGGAGVPAARKWRDVREEVRRARRRHADDRAFVVVNGDESEPGTFKDRELLLRVPHLIVEAVILAGLVTDATAGFIYIRHEYPEQIRACQEAIRRAEDLGMCGTTSALGRPFAVSVFPSPGGYICGEQSALIEAMSDRRGEPRNVPPSLETNGLDDQPTLVSNVETFAWVPYIWLNGGARYAALGTNGWKGRRFFSVSGDVERPGVYEVPMGLTLRDLIHGESYGRGIEHGRRLKAIAPSGPSGGFLPPVLSVGAGLPRDVATRRSWRALAGRRGLDASATQLDTLDLELELQVFRELTPSQMLGAGLVVYAEGRDMLAQAVNALEFFRNESCGKCVPCRIGSQKLATVGANLMAGRIDAGRWDAEVWPAALELGEVMADASICGLGRSVPAPLRTVVQFFPADLAGHLVAPGGGNL